MQSILASRYRGVEVLVSKSSQSKVALQVTVNTAV